MELIRHTDTIWTIPFFWDSNTCNALINHTEDSGLFPKSLNELNEDWMEFNINSKSRIHFVSKELADGIWQKIEEVIPDSIPLAKPIGINENFRFYKYLPGQEFKKHQDNVFIRNDTEKSYYSLLIYLNEDFDGGDTTFEDFSISPIKGTAVIFPHKLLHAGNPVKKGVKYILRTDIVFRFSSPTCE